MIGDVALKLTSDLLETLRTIEEQHQLQFSELKNVDAKINDIYHVIEYVKLDAVKMMKVYKLLQNCLTERRTIKNNLAVYSSIIGGQKVQCITKNIAEKRQAILNRNVRYTQEATDSYSKLFE